MKVIDKRWGDFMKFGNRVLNVLIILSCGFTTQAFAAEAMLSSTGAIVAAQANPPWVLKSKGRSRKLDLPAYSVIENDLSAGNCVTIKSVGIKRKPYYVARRLQPEVFTANRNNIVAECGVELDKKLNFRLYIDNSLNNDQDVVVKMAVPGDLAESNSVPVERMRWGMYSKNGTLIGGYRLNQFSKSRWIRDPNSPNTYALSLVAEVSTTGQSTTTVIASTKQASPTIVEKATPAIEVKSFLATAIRANFSSRPVVETTLALLWNGQTPARDRNLYLQVLPTLSSFSEGKVCVRPIYKVSDAKGYGFFNGRGNPVLLGNALKLDPMDIEMPDQCSSTEYQSLFWVLLDTQGVGQFDDRLSLSIGQKGNDNRFSLSQSSLLLRNSSNKRIGQLSHWTSIDGQVAAVLTVDNQIPTRSKKPTALAINYSHEYASSVLPSDITAAALAVKINGTQIAAGSKITSMPSDVVELDVSAVPTTMIATSVSLTCASSLCPTIRLSEDGPSAKIEYLSGDENHLVIEWKGTSGPTELVFRPVLQFGDFETPLTTCIGHLISDSFKSEPFKLAGEGQQKMRELTLPEGITDNSVVRVSYSSSRDGGKCPVDGLTSEKVELSKMKALSKDGAIVHKLRTDSEFYVGYVSLTGPKTRHSIARWRETLAFLDNIYHMGRKRNIWVDGVLFGATERAGRVDIRMAPNNNFSSNLGSEDSYLEVAEGIQYNKEISNGYFEDNLPAIVEKIQSANTSVVYFDDTTLGCEDYQRELDALAPPMQVKHAIVIAALQNYTGKNAVRELADGLAHVCVQNDKITVYAFNQRERVQNLDWHKALAAISKDIAAVWDSQ